MRANHESDDDLRSAEAKNERRALWGGVAQLLEVFRGAAWKVELNARVFLGAAVGVWVLPNATPSESTARSVSAVSIAFSSIGLRFGSEGGPAADRPGDVWGPNSTPVRVIVGAKPEPMLP